MYDTLIIDYNRWKANRVGQLLTTMGGNVSLTTSIPLGKDLISVYDFDLILIDFLPLFTSRDALDFIDSCAKYNETLPERKFNICICSNQDGMKEIAELYSVNFILKDLILTFSTMIKSIAEVSK